EDLMLPWSLGFRQRRRCIAAHVNCLLAEKLFSIVSGCAGYVPGLECGHMPTPAAQPSRLAVLKSLAVTFFLHRSVARFLLCRNPGRSQAGAWPLPT